MERHVRNNAVAGVFVLLGAAVVAFAITEPWVTATATIPWGPFQGLSPNGGLGFDALLASGGQAGDVKPLMLGLAAFLAFTALALLATRIRGLGILWRVLGLAAVACMGAVCWDAWSVVDDPVSVLPGAGDSTPATLGHLAYSAATTTGLLSVEPGLGLWLLTGGLAVAGIGALVPAIRRTIVEPAPVPGFAGIPGDARFVRWPVPPGPAIAPSLPPIAPAGWYPDRLDPSRVRWFDGRHWTQVTRRA